MAKTATGNLTRWRVCSVERVWALVLCAGVLQAPNALAIDEAEALGRAEVAVSDAERGLGDIVTLARTDKPPTALERIAAGEVFLRQKDYKRAIASFAQVVELFRQSKASESAHADALYLLAEAYFRDDQLLSARRQYRALAELGHRAGYATYAGRALGRLVDVALRTERLDGLDFVFSKLAELPAEDASGSLAYALGKAHFARRQYADSSRALARVPDGSAFSLQAGYLTGVIYTNQGLEGQVQLDASELDKVPASSRKFAAAVLQFQRVTQMEPKTADEQHIVDLSWMALGRLFYETDNHLDSADAYNHVGRTSPEFATVLFELAWVYVRMEDYKRAEQALELLSIVSPETLSFAEGSLLRADLMLRAKDFEGALEVYQSVKSRFEPIRSDVDAFLAATSDPAVYYDRLIEDRIGIRTENEVPPVVMDWVRQESEDQRVFALIDDVTRSRELVREAQRMARKMEDVLKSSTRARAFPDLKLRLQHSLGLVNQLSKAKRTLALGLEAADDSAYSGELATVRAKRRALMDRMSWLPVTVGDFSRRESTGQEEWNKVSQRLQQLTLETDRLQAVVNGLRRVLRDSDQYGVVRSPDAKARFQAEIEANERQVEVYRRRLSEYREQIERGRVQIGFGDSRYVEDRRVRDEFERTFARELELIGSGAGGQKAVSFARDAAPLVERAAKTQLRLRQLIGGFEREVAEDAARLNAAIQVESEHLRAYTEQLDALDQHARLLVGEVAKRNFGLVRERLRSIVLRADVGIVQQAWEVREQHRERVRDLQRVRSTEEQKLNEEMKEVLEDGEER